MSIHTAITALLVGSVLLFATPAAAHHPVSETGISWVEPVSVVELSAEASSFDRGDGFSGRWQRLTLASEWRALPRLSVAARVPMIHLSLDDGRRVIGLGDVEASAKYRLIATEHGRLIASVGLGTAFPTGDTKSGLGAGHFELSPFLTLSSQPTRWLVFYGSAVDKISVGGTSDQPTIDDRAGHGSVLSPHEPHELDARLGAALLATESLYASIRVEQTVVFVGDDRGPTRGRVELGWAEPNRFRLATAVSTHLAGKRRKQFALQVSAALFF